VNNHLDIIRISIQPKSPLRMTSPVTTSKTKTMLSFQKHALIPLTMTAIDMCMTPMMTEVRILMELKKGSCIGFKYQAGSVPKV